ncbi:DUF6246 family protein [Klebsiella pneumoniae]|uniref:DUF6246 family protein n=1 Tax=Klebsiella pneumoniae TaxID=573 RepID=UPI00385A91CA
MTPVKEFGECVITAGDRDYFFRPSLLAMSRIGEPDHIVRVFHTLFTVNDALVEMVRSAAEIHSEIPEHQRLFYAQYFGSYELPEWAIKAASSPGFIRGALLSAINVLQSCCDDDVSELVGWFSPARSGHRTFIWRPGAMPVQTMILIAQSLMMHGIIGKAKIRKLQRHESSDTTSEFRASDYIIAARNHFGISREEAGQLTMTEFQLMLIAKYPEQKGYTREEYNHAADDYFTRRKRRQAMMEQEHSRTTRTKN